MGPSLYFCKRCWDSSHPGSRPDLALELGKGTKDGASAPAPPFGVCPLHGGCFHLLKGPAVKTWPRGHGLQFPSPALAWVARCIL